MTTLHAPPTSTAQSLAKENIAYVDPFAPPEKGKKKDKDKGWSCTASLVFESGRLARVSFAHKDVKSPYDWQKEKDPKRQEELRKQPVPTCDFSLPNCKPAR